MVRVLLALLVAGVLIAPGHAGLDGRYQGEINGTPATMRLLSDQGGMQGEIDASGYRYQLQGRTDGSQAEGRLFDPQTGATMPFVLQTDAQQALLILYSAGQQIPLQFSRNSGDDAIEPATSAPPAQSGPAGQPDPRLVGRWSASDSMVSGDASFVATSHVTFAADGTYLYQDGKAFASGSSAWGSTTIESQPGAGGDSGRWRVQGDLLYTRPDASGQWQLLGRIYIEGNRALVYYPDGSKTVWRRN